MGEFSMNTSDISIVVQGAVDEGGIPILAERLRDAFPKAELILSTYEGTVTDHLSFDQVVYSKDPGCTVVDDVSGIMNNVNRQITTTKAGLALVTRPYVLKTRTDVLIHDGAFLDFFEKFNDVSSEIFMKRLLICNYFTRNPRIFPTCFHPSDWMVFGLTEDVKKFYDVPFQTEEDANWFRHHEKTSMIFINHIARYTPEQHIFISFLRKYKDFDCDSYYHRDDELVSLTEWAFANCFIVLDYQKHLNIEFVKYNPNRYKEHYTLLHHWQWKGLYEKYCKKKNNLSYLSYRIHGKAYIIPYKIRTAIIKILDILGLKEFIKKTLTK